MSTQLKMNEAQEHVRRRKPRLIWFTAVVATLSLSAWAWQSVKAAETSQSDSEATTARSNQTNEVIATTLSPSGFSPAEITHAAGAFNLRVTNKSGQEKITLRLSQSDGEKVAEVKLTNKVHVWTGPFELAAGSYTLTEANHPDWICRIEVTAQ